MKIYSLDILLSWFGTGLLFHVLVSWPTYTFLRRQVRRSGIAISLRIFHSFFDRHKDFSIVNKTEVYVFLESFCFVYDPTDASNLMSDSPAFSKYSLNIWKFSVQILLKPVLKDFEHDLAKMWNECNCAVVWMFFGIALLWDWNETDLFQYCGHCWVFQICCITECSTLTASYLRFEIAQLEFHHIH